MNRRRFVQSFGTSTLLSAFVLHPQEAAALLKTDGLSILNRDDSAAAGTGGSGANPVWRRPVIVPVPTETAGISTHVIDLAGVWKFNLLPPPEFWSNSVDPSAWADITVPGELTARANRLRETVSTPTSGPSMFPRMRRVREYFCDLMAFTATRECG